MEKAVVIAFVYKKVKDKITPAINLKVDETIEKVLDEILPEAFAIMKSTARRFAEQALPTSVAPWLVPSV